MKAYYLNINDVYVDIIRSDNLKYLKTMEDNSVHSVVCDPPYEISFMYSEKNKWDRGSRAHDQELWAECLRVLKPGGYLLAFSATRTYHRLATAIEDAGFLIRDQLAWMYGSGMPHGLNVAKAIDKHLGVKPTVIGSRKLQGKARTMNGGNYMGYEEREEIDEINLTRATSKQAKLYEGFNTHLKPAVEPIVMAQKPLSEKTIVKNILRWGTGAINIDGCRTAIDTSLDDPRLSGKGRWITKDAGRNVGAKYRGVEIVGTGKGRYPANLLHDGSDEVRSLFPSVKSGVAVQRNGGGQKFWGKGNGCGAREDAGYKDDLSAARFFYCAKRSKSEKGNSEHPTIKPIRLMRYLTRLITPPGGIVLDHFAGTGTTGYAAYLEGFDSILIEQSKEYVRDTKNRFRPLLAD